MFFVFIVTLGATSFLSDEQNVRLESMIGGIPSERPTTWWESIPIIGPIMGFFRAVFDGVVLFWTLLTISSSIRWVTALIITPFAVTLFYVVLGLIRGGK